MQQALKVKCSVRSVRLTQCLQKQIAEVVNLVHKETGLQVSESEVIRVALDRGLHSMSREIAE